MSEVALPQTPGAALATPFNPAQVAPTQTTVDLIAWAQELEAAHKIGTALAATEFAPASFRGNPDAVAAAILAGKSLGLDPMNALQNIFVVKGRPAMYARTMVALVLNAGHDVRRGEATNESVTVLARRKGQAEWQEFVWTIERAKKAGYTSNAKYTSDPIAMLTAKAQAEACRTIAPDVLTGISATSVEEVELEDMGEQPATSSVRQAMATAAPAPAAAQSPAPAKAERKSSVARAQAQAAPLVEMMAPGQWTHLQAAIMAAGHKTGPAQGKAIEEQLNRPLNGPDDLTAQEASDLLEFFNGAAGAPAAIDPEVDAAWLAGAK